MMENDYLNGYLLLKKYGFSYDEVVKIMNDSSFSRVDDTSLVSILDNNCKSLLDRGYSLNEIRKMALLSSRSLTVSDGKRKIIEDMFLELGMSFEEFKNMSIKCGNIYSYSKERLDEYINFFRNLGIEDNLIVKIFKYNIFILRGSVNRLNKLYKDLIDNGFTHNDIYVMTKGGFSFWSHNFDKIKSIINTFIGLGFSFEQTKRILRNSSSLIGYNEDTIVDKFNELISLGFSYEELRYIVCEYPTIINIDINRTRNILEFFKDLGLYECLLMKPKAFLIQGIETSYSRYCFYKEKGINIDKDTYSRLFCGWKKFESLYGIGKEELLEKYPYNDINKCNKK